MNPKFFDLSKEKQARILNGALKAFSQADYKHTITDDIAAYAGISKGLLFHYFENKKTLYLYLYQYSMQYVQEHVSDQTLWRERDFFDLIAHSQQVKLEIMHAYPYLFDFLLRAYYEKNEGVAAEIAGYNHQSFAAGIQLLYTQTDLFKFKEGIDVKQVINLILYSAEGFMKLRLQTEKRDLEALSDEFLAILALLKQNFYKEEYL